MPNRTWKFKSPLRHHRIPRFRAGDFVVFSIGVERVGATIYPQQCLNFLPEPQGQGSFRQERFDGQLVMDQNGDALFMVYVEGPAIMINAPYAGRERMPRISSIDLRSSHGRFSNRLGSSPSPHAGRRVSRTASVTEIRGSWRVDQLAQIPLGQRSRNMSNRQEVLLGGPSEARMGLARAVRVGTVVSVGGTAAISADGSNVDPDDIEAQTRRCYEIVGEALERAGASFGDVVRTRTMLVDIADYETSLQIRRQVLGDTRAAETIVEVSRFVDPDWRIEIEVDAVIAE